jgi:hypothetical protein
MSTRGLPVWVSMDISLVITKPLHFRTEDVLLREISLRVTPGARSPRSQIGATGYRQSQDGRTGPYCQAERFYQSAFKQVPSKRVESQAEVERGVVGVAKYPTVAMV